MAAVIGTSSLGNKLGQDKILKPFTALQGDVQVKPTTIVKGNYQASPAPTKTPVLYQTPKTISTAPKTTSAPKPATTQPKAPSYPSSTPRTPTYSPPTSSRTPSYPTSQPKPRTPYVEKPPVWVNYPTTPSGPYPTDDPYYTPNGGGSNPSFPTMPGAPTPMPGAPAPTPMRPNGGPPQGGMQGPGADVGWPQQQQQGGQQQQQVPQGLAQLAAMLAGAMPSMEQNLSVNMPFQQKLPFQVGREFGGDNPYTTLSPGFDPSGILGRNWGG